MVDYKISVANANAQPEERFSYIWKMGGCKVKITKYIYYKCSFNIYYVPFEDLFTTG